MNIYHAQLSTFPIWPYRTQDDDKDVWNQLLPLKISSISRRDYMAHITQFLKYFFFTFLVGLAVWELKNLVATVLEHYSKCQDPSELTDVTQPSKVEYQTADTKR